MEHTRCPTLSFKARFRVWVEKQVWLVPRRPQANPSLALLHRLKVQTGHAPLEAWEAQRTSAL